MCKDALADQLKMTTEQVDAMCAWWEARRKREKEQQVVDVRCEMDSTTLENDDEEQHSIAGNGIFPQSTSGKSDGDLISCIESENSGHHGYYVSAREDVDMGAAEAIKAKVEALPLEVRTNPRQGNVGLKYAVRKFINERCQNEHLLKYLNRRMIGPESLYMEYVWLTEMAHHCSRLLHKSVASLDRDDFLSFAENYPEEIREHTHRPVVLTFFSKSVGVSMSKTRKRVHFEHAAIESCKVGMVMKGDKANSIATFEIRIKGFIRWMIRVLPEFCGTAPEKFPVWKITSVHLNDYMSYLQRCVRDGEMTEMAARQTFEAAKHFLHLCYRRGVVLWDVATQVDTIRAEAYTYKELPSVDEILRFRSVVERYGLNPDLDLLAFDLTWSLGIRRQELTFIRWGDVDLVNGKLQIKRKGGRWALLPLPDQLVTRLSKQIATSEYVFGDDPEGYACALGGRLRIYAAISDWKYQTGFHLYRHVCLTEISKTATPSQLMSLSGNGYLAVSFYLHRRPNELLDAVDKERGNACDDK